MSEQIQIILPSGPEKRDRLVTGLRLLTRAICRLDPEQHGFGLAGPYGYGALYENEVFSMRPDYQDAECDCGANDRGEQWHASHPHAPDCFQKVLQSRFAKYDEESGYNAADAAYHADDTMERHEERTEFGTCFWTKRTPKGEIAFEAWKKAHDARAKAHKRLTRELYRERGISPSPYQWFCTCGVDDAAKIYFKREGAHSSLCALELPNFRHKASGFEVRWYKWIGRDQEMRGEAPALAKMFRECLRSIRPISSSQP